MVKRILDSGYRREIEDRIRANESFELPDFYLDENGKYVVSETPVTIKTLKGFNDYIKKHREVFEFFDANFSKIVSAVYKKTLALLIDPTNRTSSGRVLSGQSVNHALVYQDAYASDPLCVFKGFLTTYNAKNMGFEGKERVLPCVERTKKEFLDLFKEDQQGYIIPEIDKDGLVVRAAKQTDDFHVNVVAVPVIDITQGQFFAYLSAPFGDRYAESGVDFAHICELCEKAYAAQQTEDQAKITQELIEYCSSVYPYSFKGVKVNSRPADPAPVTPAPADPAPVEEEPVEEEPVEEEPVEVEPVEEEPVEEEPVEEEPVEIAKPKSFVVSFKPIPRSNIRRFGRNDFKYYSGVQKMVIEEKERD